MSSVSRSSTITGLIFLLFDAASAREVPFAMLLYIKCILHGLTSLCPIHLCSAQKVSILW